MIHELQDRKSNSFSIVTTKKIRTVFAIF